MEQCSEKHRRTDGRICVLHMADCVCFLRAVASDRRRCYSNTKTQNDVFSTVSLLPRLYCVLKEQHHPLETTTPRNSLNRQSRRCKDTAPNILVSEIAATPVARRRKSTTQLEKDLIFLIFFPLPGSLFPSYRNFSALHRTIDYVGGDRNKNIYKDRIYCEQHQWTETLQQ